MIKVLSSLPAAQGAEIPSSERPVDLDPVRLMSELRRTLGMPPAAGGAVGNEAAAEDSGSEGSSFFSDASTDDEGDDEEGGNDAFLAELERQMGGIRGDPGSRATMAAQRTERPPGEVPAYHDVETETDSDDVGSDGSGSGEDDDVVERPGIGASAAKEGFFNAYSAALEEQLAGTRMAESFECAAATNEGEPVDDDDQQGEPTKLRPVNLDMNLVKSLLRSVAAQEGQAGPAGTLVGLLGIELPKGLAEEHLANQ